MQKSDKILPVIIINKEFVLNKNHFEALKDFKKIVFINTTGIFSKDVQQSVEKSFMDFGYEPEKIKDMFFVHMNRLVFDRIKADTEEKKLDFSIWHFFYDIFKVPKYNFKNQEYKTVAAILPKSLINFNELVDEYVKSDDKYIFVDKKNLHSGCIFDIMAFEKMQIESFDKIEEVPN